MPSVRCDRGDEVAACDVVRGRERLALLVVGPLLGHRGSAERTPDDDTAECARRTAELALDELAVCHEGRLVAR
jgi:hypothetical protein